MTVLLAAGVLALLAAVPVASPSPAGSAAATPAASLTVVCYSTPFYVFVPGTDRPVRARTPDARLGQRFRLVSGLRSTLDGFQYYETDVTVVEPGYPGSHYWIARDCAIPVR